MAPVAVALMLAGAVAMAPYGDLAVVGNVPRFLFGAAIMSLGYVASWAMRRPPPMLLWAVAIGTRLLLLAMEPGDDIWRYVWEGRIGIEGFNPYLWAPDAGALLHLRDPDAWPRVGHATLTTVYPPLAQMAFRAISWASDGPMAFRLAFAAADLGVAWVLCRRFGIGACLLYAWNPLVVYSFAGGGHYDSLFLLALVGSLALEDGRGLRWATGSLLLGASIAIKWASGPLALWWVWRAWREGGWRAAVPTAALCALPVALCWTAFFPGTAWHQLGPHEWVTFAKSAQLLPYLLEVALGGMAPPNQVWLIPVLGLAAWIARRGGDAVVAAERFFFGLMVLAPAVHGWYFTWYIAAAAPLGSWSARWIGISGFAYFWLQHVNATRGVWVMDPGTRALLWVPFLAPALIAMWRGRPDDGAVGGPVRSGA